MIKIKTIEEVAIMAEAGGILAKAMQHLSKEIKPGISTAELDRLAESLLLNYGGQCSFKGYQGFPSCLCTSINEEVVHAIPSKRLLKKGDIISLDMGFYYKGYHSDMAITLPVGQVEPDVLRLIRVTKKALKRGIKAIRPGKTIGHISNSIQRYVESQGFNVVRQLCGHGIGKDIHEEPEILNYGKRNSGPTIKEGMVLCLEPMVTMGHWEVVKGEDGFVFKTADNALCSHFEQTVAVTKSGYRVLTE